MEHSECEYRCPTNGWRICCNVCKENDRCMYVCRLYGKGIDCTHMIAPLPTNNAEKKVRNMNIEKSFRHTTQLSKSQQEAIANTENFFVDIAENLAFLPESREKSLCMTRLQEAKMWACECIAKVCQE